MSMFYNNRRIISWILVLQIIPLAVFPLRVYSIVNQEWWLSALLMFAAAYAVFELLVRHNYAGWPWYLIGFAQGFNIISRLMMLLPHATYNENGAQVFDTPYVVIALISMAMSTWMLSYIERPDIKMALQKTT